MMSISNSEILQRIAKICTMLFSFNNQVLTKQQKKFVKDTIDYYENFRFFLKDD